MHLYRVVLFLIFLNVSHSYAQKENVYVPDDLESIEDYLQDINDKLISRIQGQYASRIKKVFKKRDEKILKTVEDSVYTFQPELIQYVKGILEEIYTNNPSINHNDYKFFIRNSIVPNASCYGDGFFEVYFGLLDTLKSDDEIAFVLCHEIAHKILDHPVNNIKNAISELNSDATKERVRSVKKMRYGRTRAALSIIDELNIDFLDYSRIYESEADSLGFIFFKQTKYNKSNALSALKHLDLVDDVLLSYPVKVDSVFNFPEYPFKKFWLEDEVSLFALDEKVNDYRMNSDTVKTHPDVPYRIEKLIRDFKIDTSNYEARGNQIQAINDLLQEQSIQIFIDVKKLDFALYQLENKHAEKKITEAFYLEKMMDVLEKLYWARKRHELGKYVPQKNSLSEERELNLIRKFMHALELGEIKMIGKNFYNQSKEILQDQKRNKFQLFNN